jgi:hypothetical protein
MKDIRNHIYAATKRLRFSRIDQLNVEKKINEWKKINPSQKFFFRKYSYSKSKEGIDEIDTSTPDGNKTTQDVRIENETLSNGLLLVYQKPWQQRLLTLYGNELCLLDAAYKTTRYAFPVFFLVVKTNVDYQVVGLFIVEEETTDAIKEALTLFSKWNPTWSPRFFMVDKCEEEINAIESVFTGEHLHITTIVVQFTVPCAILKGSQAFTILVPRPYSSLVSQALRNPILPEARILLRGHHSACSESLRQATRFIKTLWNWY